MPGLNCSRTAKVSTTPYFGFQFIFIFDLDLNAIKININRLLLFKELNCSQIAKVQGDQRELRKSFMLKKQLKSQKSHKS